MQYFFNEIISPLIIKNKFTDICEIGAEFGGNTDKLLGIDFVRLSTIDPCVDADLQNKYRSNDRIKIYKGFSLQVLPELSGQFDCFLIDGEHNWYTVFNELKTIHEKDLLRKGGIIFLHDVLWPYGRRDRYYFPESIPEEFRHPYSQEGIERGRSALSKESSSYKDCNNAVFEGGGKKRRIDGNGGFLQGARERIHIPYLRKRIGVGDFSKEEKYIYGY